MILVSSGTPGDDTSFSARHRGSAYPDRTIRLFPDLLSKPPYPFREGDPLSPELLSRYAEEIRDEPREYAFVFDRSGAFLRKLIGEEERIRFWHRELLSLHHTIFLHNHPRGSSFSFADIEAACVFEMRCISVVTGGEIHLMMPPAGEEYFSRRLLHDISRCYRIRLHCLPVSHRLQPSISIWILVAADLDLRLWRMPLRQVS